MENNYIITKAAYNSHYKYQSQASQDKFVAHLLDFKKDGYVIDIGSSGPENNSQFFNTYLDWKSICIDTEGGDYNRKNCRFYNTDATKINYEELFVNNGFPTVIDYLSLDVDDCSNTVLKILPFDKYKFSVITVEHDAYVDEQRRKPEQRQLLSDVGYHILCSDVWFKDNNYFEDWWINPTVMDLEKYKFLQSDKESVDVIIGRFNK